jgi:hypothetical protein
MGLGVITTALRKKIPKVYHINWLNAMLWGGTVMLAIEHIAHQEIVPYPPFLTAMQNPADIPVMLHEMATIGGAMTICILAVWAIMIAITTKVSAKIKQPVVK